MKDIMKSDRRTFMKRATLLGGAALLMALGDAKTARSAAPAAQPKPVNRGYRLTEHIKKYYETARQ